MALSIQVENGALARRVYSLMKEPFGVELELSLIHIYYGISVDYILVL